MRALIRRLSLPALIATALILPGLASAQASLDPSPVPERRVIYSSNVDLYGSDLTNIFDTTLEACQTACLSNAQCAAFTFNSRSNACFPKGAVGERSAYDGAISGVVRVSDAAVVTASRDRADELSFLREDDLDQARKQALGLGADYMTGDWQYDDYARSMAEARAQGRVKDAHWFAAAMALLGDRAADWTEYARLSLALQSDNSSTKRAYRQTGLLAAINGYLRALDPAQRATAAVVIADALEAVSRGRDMIPALRLAQAQQPRAETEAMLEEAIGKYGFRVTDNQVDSDAAEPRICAQFSEPLLGAGTDYEPYVQSDVSGLSVSAEDRQLCLTGVEHGARYRVTLRAGLPAASGEVLAKPVTLNLYVRDRSPQVSFPGRGYILPASGTAALPITSVNQPEVDLTLSRLSDRNLVRAMQQDMFRSRISAWGVEQFDSEMADVIWTGKGELETSLNTEVTTRLPLGEVAGALEPGIYVLRAAIPGADPYDDPAAMQWFVTSDLGLATMSGADGLHVFVRSLGTAEPLAAVEVTLLSQANAVLGTATSDAQGYAVFAPGLSLGEGAAAPALVTVRLGDDMAFLPLSDPAFDLSDRGVEGRAPAGPIDVFLATDRGAYRAGETVHVTALSRDSRAQAIEDLPLTAVLTRPDGVEYSRDLAQGSGAGGHVFGLPIAASAPRGTWSLAIYADPQAPALATQSLLVEDFLPERIDFDLALPDGALRLTDRPPLDVTARYLFGAPAEGLEIEGTVAIEAADGLADWPGYSFGRADEPFEIERRALPYGERTDADGKATLPVTLPDIGAATDRPLEAVVTLRVAEGSGRPVERRITKPITPPAPMVGIKPAFDGPLDEGGTASFWAIGLAAGGQPAPMQIQWEVVRVETRYQWYRINGDWNWEPTTSRSRVATGEAAFDGTTPVQVTAPVDWGRYELRVTGVDGAGTGAFSSAGFSAGWYAASTGSDTPDMLNLSLDKGAYAAGDVARVRIEAREAGKGLIAVMSNRLIAMQPVDLAEGENTIELPVTDDWGAGAYVTATLIRPLDAAASRNPGRALGLAYAQVDPGTRQLKATFDMPQTAQPRAPLPVALKVEGIAPGETAQVTIAAVDQGILNITGFEPPDPSGYYFGQRRLGMGLRDVYGRLIDGMNGAMGRVRSGGDAGAAMRMQSPPPTEDLVVFFTGPLTADADGIVRTSFDLPAFNGSLRLMAVVWSKTGVGQADTEVLVRDPVVLTATLPRFLAPGDRAEMLLELTHAEGPVGRIGLDVTGTPDLTLGALPGGADIAEGETLRYRVPIGADAVGDYDVTVNLVTPDGARLTRSYRMPVRNNDPEVARTNRLSLAPGQTFTLSRDVFSGLMPGSGTATLALGPLARFDAAGLLASLDRYPYGCTEQVTSRALPQLYLSELAQAMGLGAPADISKRVDDAIVAVLANQGSNGSFGLWGPDQGDMWLDAYVGDFLSRARAQGYAVPDIAFRNAIDNLRNQVNYAPDFDAGGEGLAYALYVLAREGAASISDLRYYADVKGDAFSTPMAAAQIGAALAAYGEPTRADAMFRRAVALVAADSDPDRPVWRDDYGTPLRDAAAVLTLAIEARSEAVDRDALIDRIAPRIGAQERSTQEQVWTLLAAHAEIASGADAAILVDGAPATGPLVRLVEDDTALAPVTFTNSGTSEVALTLTTFGQPDAPEPAGGNGYTIERHYFTTEGAPVDPSTVERGTRLVAVLTVQPWGPGEARLMVSDPLPAGFEIDNPNLLAAGDIAALDWLDVTRDVANSEFRSDRFLAAVNWRDEAPFRLAYIVRAITPGVFHHPAASVEDMYRPAFRARTDSGRMNVVE